MINNIRSRKVCLIILDGWGHNETKQEDGVDAIQTANPSFFNKFITENDFLTLSASGTSVGLPSDTIGNSQVGHLTIGSGRCIMQPLLKINKLIEKKKLGKIVKNVGIKKNSEKLHLIGLVSDGGIHSHINHLFEIIRIFCYSKESFNQINIHFISDGRDTHPICCLQFIQKLNAFIDEMNKKLKCEKIKLGSLAGRWYTMDRDNNQERINKAYDTMTGKINKMNDLLKDVNVNNNKKSGMENTYSVKNMEMKNQIMKCIENHINTCYTEYESDEMIKPLLLNQESIINEQDTLFFFNFRSDRMRQIIRKFLINNYKNIITLTDYGINDNNLKIVIKNEIVNNTLSDMIAEKNMKQTHVAETEKYAHVTYFFNGGKEQVLKNENRILIDSIKTVSFADVPSMQCNRITNVVCDEITKNVPFIVLNYANTDMVGHTGNFNATVKSVLHVDECMDKIHQYCKKNNYVLIITADHGNAEVMRDKNGIVSKHTNSRVPFVISGKNIKIKREFLDKYQVIKKLLDEKKQENKRDFSSEKTLTLADVAPTILYLMEIKKPDEMIGNNLVEKLEE